MAVEITIRQGERESDEYKASLRLKEIFENEFKRSNAEGEIFIYPNVTLIGCRVKDIDIVVFGRLDKHICSQQLNCEVFDKNLENNIDDIEGNIESLKKLEDKEQEIKELEQKLKRLKDKRRENKLRKVGVRNFCFVIELKNHDIRDIQLNGNNLKVRYKGKYHNATTQSEGQKYALQNFIRHHGQDKFAVPFITNFIWLLRASADEINTLVNQDGVIGKHNFLPNTFGFGWMMTLALYQRKPAVGNNSNWCFYNADINIKEKSFTNEDVSSIDYIIGLFNRIKKGQGLTTRRKLELITSQILKKQKYAEGIGEKMVIVSGRAGTGKTIKLLRIGCDLATRKGERCLILTYNLALVSDIKRILAFAEIPDKPDNYTLDIKSMYKFFYEIILGFGIESENVKIRASNNKDYLENFVKEENYFEIMNELKEYLDENVIDENEIHKLMKDRWEELNFDYILIDEAQDWKEYEKDIIIKLFGKEKIIIADGIDQLIRSKSICLWNRGLKQNYDFVKTTEKRGLRQKNNLIDFVNKFAKKSKLNWNIEPSEEILGGKVIISTLDYNSAFHNKLFKECREAENKAYEMVFLAPPSLTEKVEGPLNKKESNFKLTKDFEKMDIKIWDGINYMNRKRDGSEYAINLSEHRVLQYDSCRGLEGWTVVNLHFDKFIKYKLETYKEEKTNELALESFEEKRNRHVALWSLIPLTRAIDTLVITIEDKNSDVCNILREIYNENPDYVEWVD